MLKPLSNYYSDSNYSDSNSREPKSSMSKSFVSEYLRFQADANPARRWLDLSIFWRTVLSAILLFSSLVIIGIAQPVWGYLLLVVLFTLSGFVLPVSTAAILLSAALGLLATLQAFFVPFNLFILIGAVAGALAGGCARLGLITLNQLTAKAAQSQALLRLNSALSNTNRHCVKLVDAQGSLQFINRKGQELMQVNQEEKIQWSQFVERQEPQQRKNLKAAFDQALQQGYGETTGAFWDDNGEKIHWQICMAGVPTDNGGYDSVLVVSYDLTELVTSRDQAEKYSAELSELLNSLDGLVIAVDHQERLIFSNSKAKDYIRTMSAHGRHIDPHQMPLNVALPDFLYNAVHNCMQELEHDNVSVCQQFREPRVGRWLTVEIYKKPSGFNLFIRDVDAQHQLQQDLKQALLTADLAQELESVGSWVYDLSTQQMNLSRQSLKLFGIEARQVQGHLTLINQLLDPSDRIKLTQAFLHVTQGEESVTLHSKIKHSSGEIREVRISLRGLFNEDRQAEKIIGSVQDVTEQKAREAHLQEAERLVRGMIDALPNQICLVDNTGTIINVNQSWRDSAANQQSNLNQVGRGANYLSVCERSAELGCEEASATLDGMRAVFSGSEEQYEYEYRLQLDGQIQWYRLRVNPLATTEPGEKPQLFVVSHENITSSKRLMLETEKQREQLLLVHESTNDGIWDWQPENNHTYYSPRFFKLLNLTAIEQPSFNQWLIDALVPEQREAVINQFKRHLQQLDDHFDLDCQLCCGDGQYRWFRLRGKARFSDRKLTRFVGSLMDINDYRQVLAQLNQQQQQFNQMAAHIPDVFWDYDINQDEFVYVSPAFEDIWKAPPYKANLRDWTNSVLRQDRDRVIELFKKIVNSGESGFAEYRIKTASGERRWVSTRCFVIKDQQGAPQRLVGTARDVTESKLTLTKLEAASKHDSLTGLVNRRWFIAKLDKHLAKEDAAQRPFAVVVANIDRMMAINESVGHDVGDKLLQQLAERLSQLCPRLGALARIGGDEFAFLIPLKKNKHALPDFLTALQASFNASFSIEQHNLFISASIGVAIYPQNGQRSMQLIRCADSALQTVRQQGGGNYLLYSDTQAES